MNIEYMDEEIETDNLDNLKEDISFEEVYGDDTDSIKQKCRCSCHMKKYLVHTPCGICKCRKNG
jgi:hypothetical protein